MPNSSHGMFGRGSGTITVIEEPVMRSYRRKAKIVFYVIWVITAEIFPNRVRGRAMSIATFANWGTNTVSVFLFPWFVGKYGTHAGFLVYAVICLIATVFFFKLVPETKGKSLEEIESYWIAPAEGGAKAA